MELYFDDPPWDSLVSAGHGPEPFPLADIECWKLGGSQLVQHGNTIPLNAAVWDETDWFKCAEEHQ